MVSGNEVSKLWPAERAAFPSTGRNANNQMPLARAAIWSYLFLLLPGWESHTTLLACLSLPTCPYASPCVRSHPLAGKRFRAETITDGMLVRPGTVWLQHGWATRYHHVAVTGSPQIPSGMATD